MVTRPRSSAVNGRSTGRRKCRVTAALFGAGLTEPLEAVRSLLQQHLDDTSVVVAVADDVVQRREAVQLARLLHVVELPGVEARRADASPVLGRVVGREAWREGAVDPNDDRVPARAAVP